MTDKELTDALVFEMGIPAAWALGTNSASPIKALVLKSGQDGM